MKRITSVSQLLASSYQTAFEQLTRAFMHSAGQVTSEWLDFSKLTFSKFLRGRKKIYG